MRRTRVAVARLAALAALAGCPPKRPGDVGDLDVTEKRERWYRLTYHGAPVGHAVEREDDDTITRIEHVEVRRGGAVVTTDLRIEIDIDADLTPRELRVEQTEAGKTTKVVATRGLDGWRRDGGRAVFAPADAVPSELIPAIVRVRGTFAGPVILPGWDLAVGDGIVISAGDRRLAARTVIADRAIDAAVELDIRGNTASVVDSTGTAAIRAEQAAATAPFQPIDVIDAAAIALADTSLPIEVTLIAGATPVPPALPGQRVVKDRGRWHVTLDPQLAGALAPAPSTKPLDADIADVAAGVHETIAPSLAGNTATAGDCTAYAVAFAGYARVADIPSQIVTGYLVDGDRLIRHRWNLAWNGSRWITVDASQPDAPAPRLGVAVSDDSVAGLTAAASWNLEPDL